MVVAGMSERGSEEFKVEKLGGDLPEWRPMKSNFTIRVLLVALSFMLGVATPRAQDKPAAAPNTSRFQIPATDDGLPGQGPIRRYDWFRKLWNDRYRVNVFVGPVPSSAIVAHSFFLVTDGEGNIIAANPKITKRYT